jgi:catechol 2,3-dioxygenase-like lactoylglutathione lyase family enzyme
MLHYVTLGSNNIARSKSFYDAALKPLGIVCTVSEGHELAYGAPAKAGEERINRLWVVRPFMTLPATWANGTMVALTAESRAAVDAFHAAALKAGGIDEGAPGIRPYHATFYSCYVRDPDGNKLSAVCEKADSESV